VPVIAARMSVLRTFFKFSSFRGARAKADPPEWVEVLGWCRIGALGRAVSFGHDSGGRSICPAGYYPGLRRIHAVRSPAHTRVRGFNFRLLFR
jgi:hypothetical protein